MNNKNNNNSKDSGIAISPSEIEKCFFAIENEFQQFEIGYITNQLRRRTNLKLTSEFPIRPLGIDFLIWFLEKTEHENGVFGKPLCEALIVKLKKLRGSRIAEFTREDWYYFNKSLKGFD